MKFAGSGRLERLTGSADLEGPFTEIRGLRDGGANGSIIGRNTFQRPRDQALDTLDKSIGIYQGKM